MLFFITSALKPAVSGVFYTTSRCQAPQHSCCCRKLKTKYREQRWSFSIGRGLMLTAHLQTVKGLGLLMLFLHCVVTTIWAIKNNLQYFMSSKEQNGRTLVNIMAFLPLDLSIQNIVLIRSHFVCCWLKAFTNHRCNQDCRCCCHQPTHTVVVFSSACFRQQFQP